MVSSRGCRYLSGTECLSLMLSKAKRENTKINIFYYVKYPFATKETTAQGLRTRVEICLTVWAKMEVSSVKMQM